MNFPSYFTEIERFEVLHWSMSCFFFVVSLHTKNIYKMLIIATKQTQMRCDVKFSDLADSLQLRAQAFN